MLRALLLTVLCGTPLYESDESGIDAYIRELSKSYPTFEQRLAVAAADSLGTPYADGPLGEGPGGQFDKDPLVDFSRADCVTFMEQSIAASAASNYGEMFETLRRIRYENGAIDFEHRNHFFITDWIEHNPFCIEVTGDLDVPTEVVTRKISRKGFFERVSAPGLGLDTPDVVHHVPVIPPGQVEIAEALIPSPSIIVFVGKVDWLFALHTGLFIRDEAGSGRLYHASSKAEEVAAVDLSDYVHDQAGRYVGIAIYRVTEPLFEE